MFAFYHWPTFSLSMQIKADVETQGDFVNSLIREVNNAVYRDIEDVVAFVKWLDDELCFLVSYSVRCLIRWTSLIDVSFPYDLSMIYFFSMNASLCIGFSNLNPYHITIIQNHCSSFFWKLQSILYFHSCKTCSPQLAFIYENQPLSITRQRGGGGWKITADQPCCSSYLLKMIPQMFCIIYCKNRFPFCITLIAADCCRWSFSKIKFD